MFRASSLPDRKCNEVLLVAYREIQLGGSGLLTSCTDGSVIREAALKVSVRHVAALKMKTCRCKSDATEETTQTVVFREL